METKKSTIFRYKIGGVDVFLEEFEIGQGKITISDTYGHNYSCYWGAMGCELRKFICQVNSDYFCSNLMGSKSMQEFDAKKTISNIRKYIKDDMNLPWYKHQEFQKDLREILNDFEEEISDFDDRYFVDNFKNSFIQSLNFFLVKDRLDRKELEEEFNSLCCEPWHFICKRKSQETKWLEAFHQKLKKTIKSKKYEYDYVICA